MSGIGASAAAVRERALAIAGLLAFEDWPDLDDSVKKRPLVLLGCDEVSAAVRIDDLYVDLERGGVSWQDSPLALTTAEFRILCCLIGQSGAFLPSRQIYDAVHGAGHHVGVGDDGHCNATRVHIKRIRRKFRTVDPDFDRIETWYAHGYRWRAET